MFDVERDRYPLTTLLSGLPHGLSSIRVRAECDALLPGPSSPPLGYSNGVIGFVRAVADWEYQTTAVTRRFVMADLKGTKTHNRLKEAFAAESQANRRYLYFAKAADIEGYPEIAGLFRDTAEGETGHAHGHLDYLKQVGDPATDMVIADVEQMLASAVAGETHEYTDMYPGMAKTAREEGFTEIADWFETLAKAERSHAGKFQRALDDI
jgi:rubrerythrin